VAGALTGRWDRLPRIAPRTRAVVYQSSYFLLLSLLIPFGLLDPGQQRAWFFPLIAFSFLSLAVLLHLWALRRAGLRTNANLRPPAHQQNSSEIEHRVRSQPEMWQDFPAYLALQIGAGISVVLVVLATLLELFLPTSESGRLVVATWSEGIILLVALFLSRRRYFRLRDVDFSTAPPAVIHVVAALLVDAEGRALMVRKRGTDRFMQPGGKPEDGETGAEALSRELEEELGLVIPPSELTFVGQFVTAAANEADTLLYADVFDAPAVTSAVSVRAEIEELLWVDPAKPGYIELAPLSSDELLPLLAARRTGQSAP
jgi:8-oxo-dGTP diphosphatase